MSYVYTLIVFIDELYDSVGDSLFFFRTLYIITLNHRKKYFSIKNTIQYGSAIAVLLLAIILVYISYFTSQARDVTDNVLW